MIQELVDAYLLPAGALRSNPHEESYYLPNELLAALSLPTLGSEWRRPTLYLVNDTEGNVDKVKATLQWGRKSNRIVVEGIACDNYFDALKQSFDIALLLDPENVSDLELREKFINLLLDDRRKLKFQGPIFRPEIKDGFTHFSALITTNGHKHSSGLHTKKSKAIIKLAEIINQIEDVSLIRKVKQSNTTLKPAEKKKLSAPPVKPLSNKSDMKLFRSLAAKWRYEHDWLLKVSSSNPKDHNRILDLSRFLAVSDPLRWFELSPQTRNDLIKKIQPELEAHVFRMSEKGQLNMLGAYLKALSVGGDLCPGDAVDVGPKWADYVSRKGDNPSVILAQLVSLKLLRDSGIASRYSLSNRGISLINSHLKNEFKSGSLGSIIPGETIFSMFKIAASK